MSYKKLNIALVAHDDRKSELIEWFKYNMEILCQHNLFATGTTGKLIQGAISNNIDILKKEPPTVKCLLSGPLGGDQMIGAMIAKGEIDVLIFFCDNLITQGHQQDVSALSRLASLYNIAFATNRTTADMIISSSLFGSENYNRIIPSAISNYVNRDLKI